MDREVIDDVMLDLIEHMAVEPEQLTEIAPLLGVAAGVGASMLAGYATTKAAGAVGTRAGRKDARNDIMQRQAQERMKAQQKLAALRQRREDLRKQLDKAKASSTRFNNSMSNT